MAAIVVALIFQVTWICTRAVLEREGVAVTDPHVVGLSAAGLAASYLTIAAAAGSLAVRLRARRVGAWIALIGALSFVAGIALYEALVHSAADHPRAMTWAIALRLHGWSIADCIMIVGFAIAAGRPGLWLAPPTIGLALLNAQPGLTRASWSALVLIALLVAKATLLVLMARSAERDAIQREPDPERAQAGLRRSELCAWAAAALSLITSIAWATTPTFFVAVAGATASVAVAAIFAASAWSIAGAAVQNYPRWLWFASAMFGVWGCARTIRTWALTFRRHWGALELTPLKTVHWSTAIPSLLAALCALVALTVFAHRTRAAGVMRASIGAVAFLGLAFSVQCALPGQTAARVACYMVANVAAALAYRVARSSIHGDVPRARIV